MERAEPGPLRRIGRIAASLAVGYGLLVVLMAMLETALVYPRPHVERARLDGLAAELGAEVVEPVAADGTSLYGWRFGHHERMVVCFSGNGGTVGAWVDRYRRFEAAGFSVLHVNYRGYPGSSGSPTEEGLIEDAHAVWGLATQTHAPEDIVLLGKSLGGGVAVALAADVRPRLLVVESSFTSAVDVGAEAYPFLPVRLLMRNRWHSLERAPQVRSPALVLHGREDAMIGPWHGEALAGELPEAALILVDGAGHNDDLLADAVAWQSFLDRAL